MTRRAWHVHLAAVLGYVLVAVLYSWPLLPHIATHVTGDPGGDTGVYVWNQWVFQHEARIEHRNPLTTERIFSMTSGRVDLTQHNYTLFSNVLALPFANRFGTIATFNAVYLATVVLTAWMTFVLARRVTAGASFEAWLAGLAFAWAPLLVARSTGHFSLVAAAPLAGFIWSLHRVERSERFGDSVSAGVCVAWAASCDAYFAVYCVLIGTIYVASRLLRLEWRPGARTVPGVFLLDLAMLLTAGLVMGLLAGRGGRFEVAGVPVSVRGLYAPVLLLTLLVAARTIVSLRPRLLSDGAPRWRAIALTAAGALAAVAALSPTLYGAAGRVLDGSWVSPPVYWRSSPRGVDLLAFVAPNPSHPLMRWWMGDALATAPTVFIEYTAAVGLVAVAVIAFAVWRARLRAPGWFWTLGIFTTMALGPFVHVGGANTFVPGPWALLRYLPLVNLARMPGRFAIVAALCVSVLFAMALVAIGQRWPHRRRPMLAMVGLLLAFELLPSPRPLYSARVPAVYDTIRADPRPIRVLELPFGVRDGVSSEGDFSARYQFNQTVHGKKLIGGYLSRVSSRRFRQVRAIPTLAALLTLSQGRPLADADRDEALALAPGLVQRASIGWVVMHPSRMAPGLAAFAERAFELEFVGVDGDSALYRPRVAVAMPSAAEPFGDVR